MGRQIVGVVLGWLAWLATALVAGVFLRWLWPEYVAASADMAFTLAMKLTRLSIGALATVAAGAVAALVGRSIRTAAIAGAILLAAFIPVHISLWGKFPLWYHLTFLVSLVPLAVLGGRLAPPSRRPA